MSHTLWDNDLLGRKNDAEFLVRFLTRRHEERKRAGIKGSYVLNVNAPWGYGKSYFVRGLVADLKEHYPVVLIDAWKNDFSDDPYTMVISEINAVLEPLIKKSGTRGDAALKTLTNMKRHAGTIFLSGLKGAAKKAIVKITGDGGEQIIELMNDASGSGDLKGKREASTLEIAADAAFDAIGEGLAEIPEKLLDKYASRLIADYQEVKKSQEEFQDSLSALLNGFDQISELKLPLFVVIDELDRCRPSYAVALLERIKHLFDIDEIVFIIATDTTQLRHAITGLYGGDFDAANYLQRFFTRTYSLPEPSPHHFIEAMIVASGVDTSKWHSLGSSNDNIKFLADASKNFNVGLRGIQRCMDILFDLTTSWEYKFAIELLLMYPLIVGFVQQQDISLKGEKNWLLDTARNFVGWDHEYYTSERGVRKKKKTAIGNYIISIASNSNATGAGRLSKLHGENIAHGTPEHYISQIFIKEFADVYVQDETETVLSKYPNLIRYAGNLNSVIIAIDE